MDLLTVMDYWSFVKEWSWIPLTIIYLSTILTILFNNGNPTKTMAWILVIVFLPIVGVIIYFFFGQGFKKEQYFKRIDKTHKDVVNQKWNELENLIQDDLSKIEENLGSLTQVFRYLNNGRIAPPSRRNN